MASVDGGIVATPGVETANNGGLNGRSGNYQPLTSGILFYKMVGQDAISMDFDTWIVTGSPDVTGAHYAGARATPLRNIAVAATWEIR